MLSTVALAVAEGYLFRNTIYPPVYLRSERGANLSNEAVLNASLVEIVQGIEQSSAFALLKLEHSGEFTLESINLNMYGNVRVLYSAEDKSRIQFISSGDAPYSISVSPSSSKPFSQRYPSNQPTSHVLEQFDSLGIRWFYNTALEIANNRTENLPSIDDLTLELTFGEHRDYQGLSLLISGLHSSDERHYGSVLITSFQPDGTLIYMSQPSPPKN